MAFKINPAVLNSASARLEVIGNNISNSGVTGFKSSSFSDVLSSSSSAGGNGSRISGSRQTFKQGTIESSTNTLDMAINGKGFFQVNRTSDGTKAFTRDGTFGLNDAGYIVNTSGDYLLGFGLDESGKNAPKSTPVQLKIETDGVSKAATKNAEMHVLLDSRLPVVTVTPFDSGYATTYSSSTIASIYDDQGSSHEFKVYYVKTGVNTWDIYGETDGLGSNMVGTPPVNTKLKTISFGADGQITPAPNSLLTIPYKNSSGSASSFKVNYSDVKQIASDFQASTSQDGYPNGTFLNVNVDKGGNLYGNYSNGKSNLLGRVALFLFKSETNLAQDRNNQFVETSASGKPYAEFPGDNGAGQVMGASVETSDVDLTSEMIKLIAAQRTYQANSEVVKRQDQIMQTVIGIGQ